MGTRSIRYLTKLLKQSFDESECEEAFATWEFEINRYERDNSAILPDNIKIAVLPDETREALQQHLQLTASQVTDYQRIRTIIIEYYRAAASFSRMQQLSGQQPKDDKGPAPMVIGATWKGKGKGKGKKGHHKGKGKSTYKGKGYNNTYHYNNKGKGKGYGLMGQGNPLKVHQEQPRQRQVITSQRKRKGQHHNIVQMWPTRSHLQLRHGRTRQHARSNIQLVQRPTTV